MPEPAQLIPHPVARLSRSGEGDSTIYDDHIWGFDFALDGLPFVSAATPEEPIRRKSIPVEKPRTDDSPEPGEQTFGNWWVKSQSSFHGGAGLRYTDDSLSFDRLRFSTSIGVDVWQRGQASLLNAATPVFEGAAAGWAVPCQESDTLLPLLCVVDNTAAAWELAFWSDTEAPVDGVLQPVYVEEHTSALAAAVLAVCSDGTTVYFARAAGIYKAVIASSGVTVTRLYNETISGTVVLGFVKQRLVLGLGANIYELDQNATVDSAFPAAKFTHPTPGWRWSAVADGPNAIYVSGHAGESSAIYKFVLANDGLFPTLTTGITACELPRSEVVTGMASYLGAMLGVATSEGFRLGAFDGSNVNLGPLTIEGVCPGPVTSYKNFFYVGYVHSGGQRGLARVDVAFPLTDRPYQFTPENIFAWAPDMVAGNDSDAQVTTGTIVSAVVWQGRPLVAVSGVGVYRQHPSRLVREGTLRTSRIRMGTLENKNFQFIRVRGEGTTGYVQSSVARDQDNAPTPFHTLSLAVSRDTADLALSGAPFLFATLTFTLTRDELGDHLGPVFTGYQLKSVPAVMRQRVYQVPVNVFDREFTRTGEPVPNLGRVIDRIREVEAIESAGRTVEFATLALDGIERERVVVEDVDFRQSRGPFEGQGFGGILVLTLRTVR